MPRFLRHAARCSPVKFNLQMETDFHTEAIESYVRVSPDRLPSFSSKRGHVTVKHVFTGRKHDKLGNQTFTNGTSTFHVFHLLVE